MNLWEAKMADKEQLTVLTYNKAAELFSVAGSPFYLCDGGQFRSNFDRISRAFSSRWPNFILAYSYKTNYIPYLCKIVKEKGGWAEVVSRLEYDLACKNSQDPTQIIFNGPVKQYDDIEMALNKGSIVNLDSAYEIELVRHYAEQYSHKRIPIGIRVNMGLTDSGGQSHIQNRLPVGRFGFDPAEIKSQLQTHNLEVVSLHGHTSTTDRSLWCYETITRTLCEIAERDFPQTVKYINIGGGIFGDVPVSMGFTNIPTFDNYAETVCKVLKQNRWAISQKPMLVLEPGIAMSANVISLITRVVGIKTIKDKILVTVDGSAFHVKPTLHTRNLPWSLIPKNNTRRPSACFSVVGATCMEKDYLLTDVEGLLPHIGDTLRIDQAGAYTIVLSPPFINPDPAIVAADEGNFKVIRSRQSLDEMFRNYVF
jgi:diaminopimelate decarboxylase